MARRFQLPSVIRVVVVAFVRRLPGADIEWVQRAHSALVACTG
jgi:hypothetical protein